MNTKYLPRKYPNADLRENFCRNPGKSGRTIWCYTGMKGNRRMWGYCGEVVKGLPEGLWGPKGIGYRGKKTQTRTGKTCQAWASQSPQKHGNTPAKKPTNGLEGNLCRNPDGGDTIWCYTTDPKKRWEYCDPILD